MNKLDMSHKMLLLCTLVFVLYIAISCFRSFGSYESLLVSNKSPLSVVSQEDGAFEDLESDDGVEVGETNESNGSAVDISNEEQTDTSQKPGNTGTSSSSGGLVNINTAGVYELDRLPGVGEATAKKIIAYRDEHGPFKSVDELILVSGIGEKKLADMRPYVTVD